MVSHQMKVKDAIRYLSELPEDEEIVIAWWRQDSFYSFEPSLTDEEWNERISYIEKWIDWSRDHEAIGCMLEEAKNTR
jgi:hypothetical protein